MAVFLFVTTINYVVAHGEEVLIEGEPWKDLKGLEILSTNPIKIFE